MGSAVQQSPALVVAKQRGQACVAYTVTKTRAVDRTITRGRGRAAYTIYKEFKHFTNLNILIVGDILHSRVAHGGLDIMRRLGMNCYIASPNEYKDETLGYQYVNLNDSIKDMDVIMLLRVQNERHHEKSKITNEEYNRLYGLNIEKVALMKKQAIIMHPAPFNRGVEITDEVVECEKSRIFAQMTNGVFVRQSILKRTFTDE